RSFVPCPSHLFEDSFVGQLRPPSRDLAHSPADRRVSDSHDASPSAGQDGSTSTGRPVCNERSAASAMAKAFSPSSTLTGGGASRRTASTKASSSRRYAS